MKPILSIVAVAFVASAPALAQRASAVRTPAPAPAPEEAPAKVEPHVLIVEVRDEAGELLDDQAPFVRSHFDSTAPKKLGPGLWSFHTRTDADYTVGRFSNTRSLVEQEIVTGDPGLETRTTLFVGPKQELGKLPVVIQVPSGISCGIRVAAFSPRSDEELKGLDGSLADGRWKMFLALPPGWYTVRATPTNTGWVSPAECKVAISPGDQQECVLSPVLGGQLRFNLDPPPDKRLSGVLHTADDKRVSLYFTTVSDGTAGLVTSRAVEPGTQEVTIEVRGYEPVSVAVDVRAGVRSDVPIVLIKK
jgi:hypothetical protein